MSNPLGKESVFSDKVDESLLYFIERKKNSEIKIKISGEDIWNCYEFSWLTKNKIPKSGICRIRYDSHSGFIVESKSLKLYLASFYNTSFHSETEIEETIYRALDPKLYAGKLTVSVINIEDEDRYSIMNSTAQAFRLETLDIAKENLVVNGENLTEEYLCFNAFRSVCPVTGQPDWATVEIHYKGKALDRSSVLGYLMSFRKHAGYHEEVCETIYFAIAALIKPEFLFVRCNFLRRGGIDINPVRYSPKYNYNPTPTRILRQ